MKISTLTGLALAGALAVGSAAPAMAQNIPFDPYYITPKMSYTKATLSEYSARTYSEGIVGPQRDFIGKDGKDSSFGLGLAVGYDFGAYTEYPIRMELEYMNRSNLRAKYADMPLSNSRGSTLMIPSPGLGPDIMEDYGISLLSGNAKVDAKVHTLMSNFYLDFPTDTAFTPYVQVGLGGAYIDSKTTFNIRGITSEDSMDGGYWHVGPVTPDPGAVPPVAGVQGEGGYALRISGKHVGQQNSWNFAWNAGAGFAYQFKDNMAFDVNYRYSNFGTADFGTNKYRYTGSKKNPNWDRSKAVNTVPLNVNGEVGTLSTKAQMKMDAHEVIVGLRITAW